MAGYMYGCLFYFNSVFDTPKCMPYVWSTEWASSGGRRWLAGWFVVSVVHQMVHLACVRWMVSNEECDWKYNKRVLHSRWVALQIPNVYIVVQKGLHENENENKYLLE